MMKVYLDNAATTPMAKEVIEVMSKCMQENFGNPSSIHAFGRESKALMETARRTISSHLNCKPGEIIFTSGGTEADNMALTMAVKDLGISRIITSQIEHHAVLHTAEYLDSNHPIKVDYVKLDNQGHVDLKDLDKLLSNGEKTLVSLMHANNEIGTKINLEKISEICRKNDSYLHSDTVQTMGHYPFDLEELDIDFFTCAAHKLHGPKGVGFLYCNKNIHVKPLTQGGSQERGMRGGTENLYGIIGMAKAIDLAFSDIESHINYVQGLKSYMIDELKKRIPGIDFHGDISEDGSLYTVLNVCFPKMNKQEMFLFNLDMKGIACSGGSACSSGSGVGSHVLSGIGAPTDRPNARFSFSRYTKKEEIDYALDQIEELVKANLA